MLKERDSNTLSRAIDWERCVCNHVILRNWLYHRKPQKRFLLSIFFNNWLFWAFFFSTFLFKIFTKYANSITHYILWHPNYKNSTHLKSHSINVIHILTIFFLFNNNLGIHDTTVFKITWSMIIILWHKNLKFSLHNSLSFNLS